MMDRSVPNSPVGMTIPDDGLLCFEFMKGWSTVLAPRTRNATCKRTSGCEARVSDRHLRDRNGLARRNAAGARLRGGRLRRARLSPDVHISPKPRHTGARG